ncbi:MAG: hypothetical protein DMG89_26410 [Acidobacteria bacterium]|nr:MAG: hypothetical protein DMG89_26410 [Acidobacteriota bacterium]
MSRELSFQQSNSLLRFMIYLLSRILVLSIAKPHAYKKIPISQKLITNLTISAVREIVTVVGESLTGISIGFLKKQDG